MAFRDKFISLEQLPAWRAHVRASEKRLVVTNGCFDLLHVGHVTFLEEARRRGDLLLVGVNSDASVRQLKGPRRPINTEVDRIALIAALQSVDAACIFDEVSAQRFLVAAQPDIWVKGGDYTLATLSQTERYAVEQANGTIEIIPLLFGKSTTALLEKASQLTS